MTEEQFQSLNSAIVEEIDRRIGQVVLVAQDAEEARQRTEALARKLADVTAALVAADGALANRVTHLEEAVYGPVGGEDQGLGRRLARLEAEGRQREKYEHPDESGLLSRLGIRRRST